MSWFAISHSRNCKLTIWFAISRVRNCKPTTELVYGRCPFEERCSKNNQQISVILLALGSLPRHLHVCVICMRYNSVKLRGNKVQKCFSFFNVDTGHARTLTRRPT